MSRRASSAALSRPGSGVTPVLIGLAHGSRHARVVSGVDAVLAATAALVGVPARSAYLDLTAPDLATVTANLAVAGTRTAVVLPLLFTDAFHARIDVPSAVTAAARSSGVELMLGPILGTGDDVAGVVAERLRAAGAAADEPVLLYAVGSSRPGANAAVAALAERLSGRRYGKVRAGFGTCQPRAADVLAELAGGADRPGTVVPLFVAPGLLLDAIAPAAAALGWRLAEPLGPLLAPVLSQRYCAAVRDPATLR